MGTECVVNRAAVRGIPPPLQWLADFRFQVCDLKYPDVDIKDVADKVGVELRFSRATPASGPPLYVQPEDLYSNKCDCISFRICFAVRASGAVCPKR